MATGMLALAYGAYTSVIAPAPLPLPVGSAPVPPSDSAPAESQPRTCPDQTPLPNDLIVRVGGAIKLPQRLAYVPPAYPEIARAARVAGVVILEAVVDTDGTVRTTRVLRSIPLLDDAAAEAVCQWTFSSASMAGKPVAVALTVTVEFRR